MTCLLQDRSLSPAQIKALEPEVRAVYGRHFPGLRLSVTWLVLMRGQSYMAGEPSTANTVMVPVPDGVAQQERHAFMKEFCDVWMRMTGCRADQILVNAPDAQYARDYLRTTAERLRRGARLRVRLEMLARLTASRIFRGYAACSINMGFTR